MLLHDPRGGELKLLNYDVERSSIDHFNYGSALGEPDVVQGEPYLDLRDSEVIR
jgi:hypothetical protein